MIRKRRRVLSEYEAGVSVQELAQDYEVTPMTVRQWLADARRDRADREEHTRWVNEMLEWNE